MMPERLTPKEILSLVYAARSAALTLALPDGLAATRTEEEIATLRAAHSAAHQAADALISAANATAGFDRAMAELERAERERSAHDRGRP